MKLTLISALLLCIAPVALAERPAENKAGLYLGVKGIYTQLKIDGAENSGGAGIVVADHYANGFGMEAEVTRSKSDVNLFEIVNDYTIDTAGLYGVYRSNTTLYFKVRGGLVWKRLDSSANAVTKTAFGGGIGGGYDFGRVLLEAEYQYVDADIDQFSVSVIGKF